VGQPLLQRGLDGALYGFGVDTGMHLLALITSGVFDRFPKLKLVVGHLGDVLAMDSVGTAADRNSFYALNARKVFGL